MRGKRSQVTRFRPYALADHLCRNCGGRILQDLGGGATGGGNPIWTCADCGNAASAMGPEVLCWCGFSMRGQTSNPYQCLPLALTEDWPELIAEFRSCGCDPESPKAVIGIVTHDGLRRAQAKRDERLEKEKPDA